MFTNPNKREGSEHKQKSTWQKEIKHAREREREREGGGRREREREGGGGGNCVTNFSL